MYKLVGLFLLSWGCTDEVVFVDDDNDGFVAADDCDDNNAAVRPDAIDMWRDGVDANCNGFDGPGIAPMNGLHAGVVGLGADGERGAMDTTACELTGDGVTDLLFTVQRGDPGIIRVAAGPMAPGVIATSTAPIVFNVDRDWVLYPHCGDWNGDGRDDVLGLLSNTLGFQLAVWEQPEGGFSTRLGQADALVYSIPPLENIRFNYKDIDNIPGLDLIIYMQPADGPSSYTLLSGGSPVGDISTLVVPFAFAREPFVTMYHRMQLDDDAELEAVACGPNAGCRFVDGYAFDGSDLGETLLGNLTNPSPTAHLSVVPGDFDGDGDADDLVGFTYRREADVYLNVPEQIAATGDVSPDHHIGVSSANIENVGDLDGDGIDDLAYQPTREGVQATTIYSFAALLEEAEPDDARLLRVEFEPRELGDTTAGDFDGDGLPDVVFSAYDYERSGQLGVYLSSQAP